MVLGGKKLLSRNTTSVFGAKGSRGGKKVPRRSVTVTDENNSRITRTRGGFMSNDIDVNFTTILNMFLELGYKVFWSLWSDETKETIRKYLLDVALVEEGAADEFMDVWYKRLEEEQKRRFKEELKASKAIQR